MSTFNTRKDRKPDGSPKAHNLSQFERYPSARAFYNKSPSWWNRLHTTRRRRADDLLNLRSIVKGSDADALF